ncbi:MAG: amidohydrolase family protein [Gemmatimonadota bacterium]
MTVEAYTPRSTLKVPEHSLTHAKYPFVDVHNHIWKNLSDREVDSLVREMDGMGLRVMVNLSGTSGDTLRSRVDNLARRHPNRFVVFANVDFRRIDAAGWGERAAAQLARDVRENGAAGLKIYKDLGLDLKDGSGRRVRVDDPRIDPVWRMAGELHIPVLIHSGEPKSFFDPIDQYNERWLELKQFPDRARPPSRYPPFDSVMAEQHRVFRRHPGTTFIAAHLDWYGNDLDRLGSLLDSLPNMNTELGAVLYDLGRQPRRAREFLIKYQDRVLMGKDFYGGPQEYQVYFRVLETTDEYFDYYRRRHAFWKMYGLGLPDDVLKKVYYANAARIIPALGKIGFDP